MKTIFTIFLLSLLYMTPAHARDILTWEECVSEAKKNHPDLLSAAEKVRQAKEDKAIETSSLLPQINSSVSGKSAKSSAGAATDTYSYGLTGEQLVFDGFKTIHNISGASETLKAEEYNYAVTSSNIRLNLRSAFTGLLKARELLSLTKEISKRRNENLELVRLRYEAGREHKGSLLTAEADLAGAEYEVKQAERNIMLSRRELSAEMGLAKPGPVNVAGDFIVPPHYGVKPDIDRLADSTPFLRELMARKEASRHDLKSQKADFLPRIYLNGAVGKTREEWPPGDDTWSFGMTVSLPIFEGGSRISEVKKADSKLRQAEADERSGRDSVLVTLETAWKNLRDAIENVSVRKKFLEATEERARITQAQYETGLISFDNWIIIEDNLVNAKKAFLNAEANMLIAEAYWIQAMGGTLEYD